MKPLEPKLIANLARLARADDHAPFREWLEAERNTWREFLETSRDEKAFGVAQGRAQMLSDIIKLLGIAAQRDK